jgi:hypothetical protein
MKHCNVVDLLVKCLLLQPVGSNIPDIVAYTVHTDHIIMDEIEAEVYYTSLSWRWRQCVLPVTFKVTFLGETSPLCIIQSLIEVWILV